MVKYCLSVVKVHCILLGLAFPLFLHYRLVIASGVFVDGENDSRRPKVTTELSACVSMAVTCLRLSSWPLGVTCKELGTGELV